LRRKAGYDLDDRIKIYWRAEGEQLAGVIERNKEMISSALKADEIIEGSEEAVDAGEEMKIGGEEFYLGVKV
jgi:hypothetical protein